MIEKIIDIVGKIFPSVSARRNIIDEMQKEITRLNEKQTQYENWQKTFEIRYSQDTYKADAGWSTYASIISAII